MALNTSLKLQFQNDMNYWNRTVSFRQAILDNPATSGSLIGRDPATGQHKVKTSNGGTVRASSLSSNSYPAGSRLPTTWMGNPSGFIDA